MATNIKRHGLKNMHTAGIFSDMTVDGPKIGTLMVVVNRAKNLPDRKTIGKQNPYCAARLGKEAKRTETDHRGGQTPKWDQELHYTVHDSPDYYQLTLSVFNEDKRTDLIGETRINLKEIITPGGGQNALWHNLRCKGKYAGEVRAEITYTDTRPGRGKTSKTNQILFSSNVTASTLNLSPNISNTPIQQPSLYMYTKLENTYDECPTTGLSSITCQDRASRIREHSQISAKNYSCAINEEDYCKSPQLKASTCAQKTQNAMLPDSNEDFLENSKIVSSSLSQQSLNGQCDKLERQLQEKKLRRATYHRGSKNNFSFKNYIPYEIPSIENLGILPDLGESPPPPPIHGSSKLHYHNSSSRAPAYFPVQAPNSDVDSVSKYQNRGSSYETTSTADMQPPSESYDRRGCYEKNNFTQN